MTFREYTSKAFAGFFLFTLLTACGVSDDDTSGDTENSDVLAASSPAVENADDPSKPVLAAIKVYFKLDPHLTRSIGMGDRWVSPASFTTTRQPGKGGKVDARAVGVDYRGRQMIPNLAPEWNVADSTLASVSPTAGHSVTVTMHGPGETSLLVTYGEVSEVIGVTATHDGLNDLTQLTLIHHGKP